MKKILIIDDDIFISEMYSNKLSEAGLEVKILIDSSDEKILDKITEFNPDLISLDTIMPDRDGFEIFNLIKKDNRIKDIPICFLSNLSIEDDDLNNLLNNGAIGYLISAELKPSQVVYIYDNYLKTGRDIEDLRKEILNRDKIKIIILYSILILIIFMTFFISVFYFLD